MPGTRSAPDDRRGAKCKRHAGASRHAACPKHKKSTRSKQPTHLHAYDALDVGGEHTLKDAAGVGAAALSVPSQEEARILRRLCSVSTSAVIGKTDQDGSNNLVDLMSTNQGRPWSCTVQAKWVPVVVAEWVMLQLQLENCTLRLQTTCRAAAASVAACSSAACPSGARPSAACAAAAAASGPGTAACAAGKM